MKAERSSGPGDVFSELKLSIKDNPQKFDRCAWFSAISLNNNRSSIDPIRSPQEVDKRRLLALKSGPTPPLPLYGLINKPLKMEGVV
jgi:hypothetical protein